MTAFSLFVVIFQYLYDVMNIPLTSEYSTLYLHMDFCILVGTWFKSRLMLYLGHFFTWFVFMNGKLFTCLLLSSDKWSYNFIFLYCPYHILIFHTIANYVLCWFFCDMNCVVVYGRTLCQTTFGWWVIMVKWLKWMFYQESLSLKPLQMWFTHPWWIMVQKQWLKIWLNQFLWNQCLSIPAPWFYR